MSIFVWSADDASSSSPPLGYQDALDEALIAVEQVVIPRQQPIELLPRTPELLDMQVRSCHFMPGDAFDALCMLSVLVAYLAKNLM